jgi:hypothetical protein
MFACRVLLIFIFLLHFSCLKSQHTIYLVGDAGEDDKPGRALLTLQKNIEADSLSTLIFLGDNAYPKGVNTKSLDTFSYPYLHPDAVKLHAQLSILKNYKGNVFFVSGNHDWKAQKKYHALRSIMNESLIIDAFIHDSTNIKNKNQEESHFIARKFNDSLFFYSVDLPSQICLIMFDSQFFLQSMKGVSRREKTKRMEKFASQVFTFAKEKSVAGYKIVFASHHPVYTNGNHSKFRQPLRFLMNYTPFWLLAKSGIDRWLSQDIDQPLYREYRTIMMKYLIDFKNVFFVAGHDHNLQYITETDDHHVVSGAGSKRKELRKKARFKNEFMNDQTEGFVKLIFDEKGGVVLQFVSETNEILFSRVIE